jgi:hypothetical protein
MKRRSRQHHRHASRAGVTIHCCYGVVYPLTTKSLGITADSTNEIITRLLKIRGVKVVTLRGRECDLKCLPLCLPDVARVLVPLDSARAPTALALAAHRGRTW